MKRSRRFDAMFMVVCMLMSAFVALSLSVTADESSDNGDFEIAYDPDWMEDDALIADIDEDIMFNYDFDGTSLYYLGDLGAKIELDISNDQGSQMDNIYIDITSNYGLFTMVDDRFPTTGDIDGIADGNQVLFGGFLPWFTFDIGPTGDVNRLYVDAFEIDLTYDTASPAQTGETDSFTFDLYVSSVFDADTSPARIDDHDDLPIINETDTDTQFEAGVGMQEGEMGLTNHASFTLDNIRGTLQNTIFASSGPTVEGGTAYTTAVETGPIGACSNFALYWRIDVGQTIAPGFYTNTIEFMYERDDTGATITENPVGRGTGLYVDYTPRLTASLQQDVTITQNELQASLSVVFTNEGNIGLFDIWITPSPDKDWLDVKFHHYENDDDTYETIEKIGDLGINSPSSSVSVIIAANMMLPNGTHRVPFNWSAWYYEDGLSTGEESRWVMVGGYMYDKDGFSGTPEVEYVYEDDDENRMFDTGETLVEDEWDGAYVDFEVDDDNGLTWEAFLWDTVADTPTYVEAGEGGDVTFSTIAIKIFNKELVDYKDVEVELEVGGNSPFFDPVAPHSATRLMMDPTSATTIPEGTPGNPGEAFIYFTVDVNAAWWTTNAVTPETYMVPLYVDATNNHDEVRVEDSQVDAKVNIDGFGPELFAEMVNFLDVEKDLDPGDTFTLEISIMNYGDDTAREVDVYLRADFVAGWSIVDQFVTAISPYEGRDFSGGSEVGDASWGWADDWENYDYFNRSRNKDIMPGDIGVDNVVEMVELYDWVKRRESPPQGIILWLHLDRLAAGANHTFRFEMVSDVNMVEGMTYYETLELYYVDSNGETYGPDPDEIDYNHYTPPQEVLIRSGKGEKYEGLEEPLDPTLILYAVIFVIIVFILFLIGYALGRSGKGGEKPSDEPYRLPPEDDYNPPAEDDMGPPLDEKPPE